MKKLTNEMNQINHNRRTFLKGFGATAVTAATGGLGGLLAGANAQAADVSDYKALVCVFLGGGMDNHDTIIPYDTNSYNRYAQIRSSFISQYSGKRDRNNLLQLSPDNASQFDNRTFALPPELSGMHGLFQQGNAAIIGNVGPLIQATSKSQFENSSIALPSRLFSHNDQQATWMSSSPEGAQYGWGGSFIDAALASNANTAPEFSAITTDGNELFLTGKVSSPYQTEADGAQMISLMEDVDDDTLMNRLRNHFRAANFNNSHLLQRDVANLMQNSFDANEKFNRAFVNARQFTTPFPTNNGLAEQLKAVAQTISIKDSLQVNRQVFMVSLGGFDTHSTQVTSLPRLHTEMDTAITAFYQALGEMGMASNVTLFTASDFGRTLAVNGDGTDHGWGGHHFVVGGAVKGRQIYGDIPVADLGHELDAEGGRLIPTTSVEQMADPLGRWFGLSQSEVDSALPNLANFSSRMAFV